MHKRLKYAKLRLANSDGAADAVAKVVAEEQIGSGSEQPGTLFLRTEKKSKFFTTECPSEDTFLETEVELQGAMHQETCVPNTHNKSPSANDTCPSEGPKLPKLRKKISKKDGLISNFLNSNSPADDDFEEMKDCVVAHPKQTKVQRAVKKTRTARNSKVQSDIRKLFDKRKSEYEVVNELINSHSAAEQIDPEQLQMALALSRSLADQECSSTTSSITEIKSSTESCPYALQDRRIVGIRTTLEQFGFRCKNSYTDYDLNVIFGTGCKNVKKIKHTRATHLQHRTRKELEDFIDRKIKTCMPKEMVNLSNEHYATIPVEIVPSNLSSLFWMAQSEQSSKILLKKYYIPDLVEIEPAPVGCLLKDWSKICGRETTPELQNCTNNTDGKATPSHTHSSLRKRVRETSPDLFDEFEHSTSNVNIFSMSSGITNTFDLMENDISSIKGHQDIRGEVKRSPASNNASYGSSAQRNNVDGIVKYKSIGSIPTVASDTPIMRDVVDDQSKYGHIPNELDVKETADQNTNDPSLCCNRNSTTGDNNDYNCNLNAATSTVSDPNRSAENIFEESDDPIVSFEVYSSDEEKTSPTSAQKMTHLKTNSNCQNQRTVVPTSGGSEHGFVKYIGVPQNRLPHEADAEFCIVNPLEARKGLSFNHLAVKARVREAMKNCDYQLDTVDLDNFKQSNEDGMEECVIYGQQCSIKSPSIECANINTKDEVVRITIGEESSSTEDQSKSPADTGQHLIPTDSFEEDNLNMTESYHIPESLRKAHTKSPSLDETSSHSSFQYISFCQKDSESATKGTSSKYAENTFVYLDGLIKQYNLPPLKLKPAKIISSLNSNIIDDSSPKSKKSESSLCSLARLDCLTEQENTLNLKANEIVDDLSTSQEQKYVHLNRIQNNSPKETSFPQPAPATVSDTATCLIPEQNESEKANGFESMFHDLKQLVPHVESPQYLISVKHIYFEQPSYESMSTLEIERELFKYGLKAIERTKAIKVLNHIFEKTHLLVTVQNSTEHVKKRQGCAQLASSSLPIISPIFLKNKSVKTNRKCPFKFENPKKNEWFLPLKPRKKITWTMVPLHIAFYNLVSESAELQRQILLYQPINFDEINGLLKEAGLHYEKNDLVAFLDKLCITFRYTASSGDRTKTKSRYGNK